MSKIKYIEIQDCYTKVECANCHNPINSLQVRLVDCQFGQQETHYHFQCCDIRLKNFLSSRNYNLNIRPQHEPEFFQFLNTEFPVNTFYTPTQLLKSVTAISLEKRRMWVQIFKFLDPLQVIHSICYVCKLFYEISWQNQIWVEYCSSFYFRHIQNPLEAKNIFIALFFSSCLDCGLIKPPYQMMKIPYSMKGVCRECSQQYKYHTVKMQEIRETLSLDKAQAFFPYETIFMSQYQVLMEQNIRYTKEKIIFVLMDLDRSNPCIDEIMKFEFSYIYFDINQTISHWGVRKYDVKTQPFLKYDQPSFCIEQTFKAISRRQKNLKNIAMAIYRSRCRCKLTIRTLSFRNE